MLLSHAIDGRLLHHQLSIARSHDALARVMNTSCPHNTYTRLHQMLEVLDGTTQNGQRLTGNGVKKVLSSWH
eukprot:847686-Amphidinium_carterae.1